MTVSLVERKSPTCAVSVIVAGLPQSKVMTCFPSRPRLRRLRLRCTTRPCPSRRRSSAWRCPRPEWGRHRGGRRWARPSRARGCADVGRRAGADRRAHARPARNGPLAAARPRRGSARAHAARAVALARRARPAGGDHETERARETQSGVNASAELFHFDHGHAVPLRKCERAVFFSADLLGRAAKIAGAEHRTLRTSTPSHHANGVPSLRARRSALAFRVEGLCERLPRRVRGLSNRTRCDDEGALALGDCPLQAGQRDEVVRDGIFLERSHSAADPGSTPRLRLKV